MRGVMPEDWGAVNMEQQSGKRKHEDLREEEVASLERQVLELQQQISTLHEISAEQDTKIDSLKAERNSYEMQNGDMKDLLLANKERLAAFLGAQLKAAAIALNAEEVRNTQHFPKMREYTHADFLQTIQGEARELVGLLTSIMDSFTSNLEGAKKGKRAEIQEHCAANIFAWLLEWADPAFHWPYATVLQLILRRTHRSSYVTDTLSGMLPGAPGTVSLTKRLNSYSEMQLNQGIAVFGNSVARYGYDNIPGHQGKYYHSSGRGGKDQKRKSTIATATMLQHYLPVGGEENIQKDPHFSPKSDKTVEEFLQQSEATRYLHHPRTTSIDGEDTSEADMVELEVLGFIQERLDSVLASRQAEEQRASAAPLSTPTAVALFPCPGCGKPWPSGKRICRSAEGGCTKVLKSTTDYEARVYSMDPQMVAKETEGPTYFASSQSLVRQQKGVIASCSSVKRDRAATQEDDTPAEGLLAENDTPPNYRVEILPPLMHNPSSLEDQLAILKRAGQLLNVSGFVGEGEAYDREWFYFSADLGASSGMFKILDSLDRQGHMLGNARYVLSGGHEGMSVSKIILKLLFHHGFDALGPAYNFKSDAALQRLFSGKDHHITKDFLHVCRITLVDEIILEWLRTAPEDPGDVHAIRKFALDFEDVHRRSHATLGMDILAAFALMVKGVRRNQHTVYNAGRKLLIPLMGILNHTLYFRYMVRDLFVFEWACAEEVRLEHKQHFSEGSRKDNKETPDFHMEDVVKDMKAMNTQDSAMGFQAAALLAGVGKGMEAMLFKQAGRTPPRHDQARKQTMLVQTLAATRKLMAPLCLFQLDPTLRTVRTITRTELLAEGLDLASLLTVGNAQTKTFIDSGFKILPKRVVLRGERVKARQQGEEEDTTDPDSDEESEGGGEVDYSEGDHGYE
ncbi:hypothetical protein B484DRAFT_467369, partial [Ochromonadaceae sp. CCMP2298]